MKPLIKSSLAKELILANLPAISAIDCPLDKCAGRILRQSIASDRPMPPFDRSMMDGFALDAAFAEAGKVFKVVANVPAGMPQTSIGNEPNSCAEIMTGAILPLGADCVVPYEDTERISESEIRIIDQEPIHQGDFVHKEGSDFASGEILIEPGSTLGSREIAVAASCGYATLKVSKMPSIAIACSGDELVEVDIVPESHQIRRSNDYAIETGLARAQLSASVRTHLPDDISAAKSQLIKLIRENTFIILSGGISMGKKDFIPGILEEQDLKCHFHGVAQRPGKPMGFWSNSRCAVFALPGNPLSTLTCLHHYVIPALRKAMTLAQDAPSFSVTLTKSEKVRPQLTVFLPVTIQDNNQALPCPPQNSGDLVRILQSDGYIEVPVGEDEAKAGQSYPFNPWY
ncbi:MAG: molybdopterin molybdotransferase MoeA [Verrucomicrobiota bacterium]